MNALNWYPPVLLAACIAGGCLVALIWHVAAGLVWRIRNVRAVRVHVHGPLLPACVDCGAGAGVVCKTGCPMGDDDGAAGVDADVCHASPFAAQAASCFCWGGAA